MLKLRMTSGVNCSRFVARYGPNSVGFRGFLLLSRGGAPLANVRLAERSTSARCRARSCCWSWSIMIKHWHHTQNSVVWATPSLKQLNGYKCYD